MFSGTRNVVPPNSRSTKPSVGLAVGTNEGDAVGKEETIDCSKPDKVLKTMKGWLCREYCCKEKVVDLAARELLTPDVPATVEVPEVATEVATDRSKNEENEWIVC